MNKKIFGIAGIRAIDCNWNASWEKTPKALVDGTIYGSDKALKFSIRNYWKMQGESVLITKSYKKVEDKKGGDLLQPRTLEERYVDVFGPVSKSTQEVLENLYSTLDVRNFGVTFAVSSVNVNGTGVVQIGIGRNLYANTIVEKQTILSPFRNSSAKGDEALMSTNGEQYFTDEAHYCYPFDINPLQMKEQTDISEKIIPYSEEDYNKFIEAISVCATAQNSCSKIGAENEYLIIVEGKEDENLNLPNLSEYVSFEKTPDDSKDVLNIEKLKNILNSKIDKIDKIRIYYDQELLEINTDGLNCEVGDILSLA